MDVAVATRSTPPAGWTAGRLEVIHVDAKSDLNLVGDRDARGDREGRGHRRPDVRRRPRRARARARRTRRACSRSRAPARRGSASRRSDRSRSTRTRAPRRRARSTPSTRTRRRAGATRTCSATSSVEYTKVVCERLRDALGGARRRGRRRGHVPAGGHVDRRSGDAAPERGRARLRLARLLSGGVAGAEGASAPAYDGPDHAGRGVLRHVLARAATPHLSNVWVAAVGSSYGDDPRDEVNAFFQDVRGQDGRSRRSSTRTRCSATRSCRRSRSGIEQAGTTEGAALAERARDVRGRAAARRADDVHARTATSRSSRSMLIIRVRGREASDRPANVRPSPSRFPTYPC